MMRPGFFEGVGLALVAAVSSSVLLALLVTLVSTETGWRILITILLTSYVAYLLVRSRNVVGRVTVATAWVITAVAAWWLTPGLLMFALWQLLAVWLIRSLYFHAGVFAALADLGLSGLALASGIAAGTFTQSTFVCVWTFFLVQALFVLIPPSWPRRSASAYEKNIYPRSSRFEQAHEVAEAALRRMTFS